MASLHAFSMELEKTVSLPQSTLMVENHSTLVGHTAICVGLCMMDDRRKNEEQYFFFLNQTRVLHAPPT